MSEEQYEQGTLTGLAKKYGLAPSVVTTGRTRDAIDNLARSYRGTLVEQVYAAKAEKRYTEAEARSLKIIEAERTNHPNLRDDAVVSRGIPKRWVVRHSTGKSYRGWQLL